MEKMKTAYRYLQGKYRLLARKKYTTVAGTLVFFFIMSIVPLSFWLTLLIGRLPLNTDKLLQLPVFASVQNIFAFVQQEARNATASVSAVLLVSTLYSSTNLFYQMRRSGEIIYDYHRTKAGFRVRISALVLTFMIMLMFIVFFALFALGTFLFSRYFPPFWERVADYALLLVLAFALVWLLNMYICPYKMPKHRFLPGTLFTLFAWVFAVIGFSLYMRWNRMDKLYGTLTTIIVFLLWLYVLMICFVSGVIINSERVDIERKKKARTQQNKRQKPTLAHKNAG